MKKFLVHAWASPGAAVLSVADTEREAQRDRRLFAQGAAIYEYDVQGRELLNPRRIRNRRARRGRVTRSGQGAR